MKPSWLAYALTLTISSTPHQSPPTVPAGAGADSCGLWVAKASAQDGDALAATELAVMLSWVQGFVIGSANVLTIFSSRDKELTRAEAQARFGTVSGWAFDPPDPDAIQQWVTKYCREHPLTHLVDASFALTGELIPKKK